MSIPLDRLYHYIENIAEEVYGDVVIYRFCPHGSKKLEDLQPLYQLNQYNAPDAQPHIICHDQEPLDFDFYQNYVPTTDLMKLLLKHNCYNPANLYKSNIFDKLILLHSEKNSSEITKYQDDRFIPVYYWSHAFIALDWFRFAAYVEPKKNPNKTFLIYNRAWQGTREYRLKFVDFLHNNNLVNHCQIKFNCVDPESNIHYEDHVFKNSAWKPKNNLSDLLLSNNAPSYSSADFNLADYESTDIEVVLETLFDDRRIHLTEKILRSIACQQPFILASTVGSLSYLREYGFKTYHTVWDESYDQIDDPYLRLQAIVRLMSEITQWDQETKRQKLNQAKQIAIYNKKHFFSQDFFNRIRSELEKNLKISLIQLVSTNTSKIWLERRKQLSQIEEIKKILTCKEPADHKEFNTKELLKTLSKARQYYLRSLTP
jgi:hypothetical protein